MGTPAYMPPEQAENCENSDHRSDVYSLGAILFKLMTGKEPFVGNSTDEIIENVKSGKLQKLEKSLNFRLNITSSN